MLFIIKDLKPISQYQYLSSNKRYVSPRGKEWSKEFCSQIETQMKEKNYTMLESEHLEVYVKFILDNRRKNDLDNLCKYVLDKLSDCNCIKEDRYITRLILEKTYIKVSDVRMVIQIREQVVKEDDGVSRMIGDSILEIYGED